MIWVLFAVLLFLAFVQWRWALKTKKPVGQNIQIYSMQRQMKKRMMREAPLSPRQWKKFKKQMQREDRA